MDNKRVRTQQVGKAESKVIKHLAENPKENIYNIKNGIGYEFHSPISNAVHNLARKGYVTTLGSYKSEKGNKVNLWGLTIEGVSYSFFLDVDVTKVLSNYTKYYSMFKGIKDLNTILEEELGELWAKDQSEVIGNMAKAYEALADAGFDAVEVLVPSMGGVMRKFLNEKRIPKKTQMKIVKRLEKLNSVEQERDLVIKTLGAS